MKNLMFYVCSATPLNGVVPTEIQVIPYGKHKTPKYPDPFLHDEASQGLVLSDFVNRMQGNDMVIDYEHQSLSEPPVEAPAAGWIKKLVNKGKDGTWAIVEWTNKAKQYIENKEYKYVSPVFFSRKADGRVVMLINLALTNNPNITGMVPLINKLGLDSQTHKEEPQMDKIAQLLGLPAAATVDDICAAINKMMSTMQTNKAVAEALGLKEGATESEISGTIMAMKQSHTQTGTLTAQMEEMKNKLALRDATEAVDLAVNAGKITPAMKDWALDQAKKDLAGFQVFVSKAPVVVNMGKVVQPAGGAEGGEHLDESLLHVCKQFGTDPKEIQKTIKESAA
jgi:phage I-like protein